MREWKDHAQIGQEFQVWLDEFLKTYKMIDPEQEQQQQNPSPGQPPRDADGPGPSPNKKARTENVAPVDASLIISANDVTQPLIHEIKMQSGWPVLHLRSEGASYLLNNTDKNWVQTHPCVAFFGSICNGAPFVHLCLNLLPSAYAHRRSARNLNAYYKHKNLSPTYQPASWLMLKPASWCFGVLINRNHWL